ncbi:MAG: signal peptidase I [Bacilli bacterium]|nr:signal peptidase I [Bacilli bacterium]
MKYIKEYVPYLIVILVILLIKKFVVTPVIVSGDSMYSTLHDKDVMILNRLYKPKDIKRYDIIVIRYNKKNIIKRVIGLPGDTIECVDNQLYVNGKVIKEEYLDKGTITNDFSLQDLFDVDTVPEGKFFVLGDNREVSLDSRSIGFIEPKDIEGQATFTIFPFNRFGAKK